MWTEVPWQSASWSYKSRDTSWKSRSYVTSLGPNCAKKASTVCFALRLSSGPLTSGWCHSRDWRSAICVSSLPERQLVRARFLNAAVIIPWSKDSHKFTQQFMQLWGVSVGIQWGRARSCPCALVVFQAMNSLSNHACKSVSGTAHESVVPPGGPQRK